jgi:anti-sigma B factor antagonist
MRVADVRLPQRVDSTTCADIRYALVVALDMTTEPDVHVDASRVETIDMAGLGVLVGAHRRARQAGRRLVLCGVQPRIQRLFAVTRLHRVLDLEQAQANVG